MSYVIGQQVRVRTVITDPFDHDVKVDPTTVRLKITKPDATFTTYTFGVDVELVRDRLGFYHLDLLPDQVGLWLWRWLTTGNYIGADPGSFTVLP